MKVLLERDTTGRLNILKLKNFEVFFHINFLKHIFDEERLKIAQLQLG